MRIVASGFPIRPMAHGLRRPSRELAPMSREKSAASAGMDLSVNSKARDTAREISSHEKPPLYAQFATAIQVGIEIAVATRISMNYLYV